MECDMQDDSFRISILEVKTEANRVNFEKVRDILKDLTETAALHQKALDAIHESCVGMAKALSHLAEASNPANPFPQPDPDRRDHRS